MVAAAKNGFPWQASVGASVEEFEFIRESQKAIVNGLEFSGPINVVRKATLGEIRAIALGYVALLALWVCGLGLTRRAVQIR